MSLLLCVSFPGGNGMSRLQAQSRGRRQEWYGEEAGQLLGLCCLPARLGRVLPVYPMGVLLGKVSAIRLDRVLEVFNKEPVGIFHSFDNLVIRYTHWLKNT